MNHKIIKAKVSDVDKFYPLFSDSLKKHFPCYSKKTISYYLKYDYNKNKIKKDLKRGTEKLYLATSDGKIVGYLLSSCPWGGVGFLSWIEVEPKFRKLGIASSLLSKWEKEAKKEGTHKVHVWTDKRNLDFYKKKGYIFLGDIIDNFFGAHDFLFYKTLGKSDERKFLKNIL